jgi:hypothetical protein
MRREVLNRRAHTDMGATASPVRSCVQFPNWLGRAWSPGGHNNPPRQQARRVRFATPSELNAPTLPMDNEIIETRTEASFTPVRSFSMSWSNWCCPIVSHGLSTVSPCKERHYQCQHFFLLSQKDDRVPAMGGRAKPAQPSFEMIPSADCRVVECSILIPCDCIAPAQARSVSLLAGQASALLLHLPTSGVDGAWSRLSQTYPMSSRQETHNGCMLRGSSYPPNQLRSIYG